MSWIHPGEAMASQAIFNWTEIVQVEYSIGDNDLTIFMTLVNGKVIFDMQRSLSFFLPLCLRVTLPGSCDHLRIASSRSHFTYRSLLSRPRSYSQDTNPAPPYQAHTLDSSPSPTYARRSN